MADIDVVRKKGGMGWVLWVVLALLVLAVVWMLSGRNNEPGRTSRAPSISPIVSFALPQLSDVGVALRVPRL